MPTPQATPRILNASARKVGGIWFLKLGRFNISFCVSRAVQA